MDKNIFKVVKIVSDSEIVVNAGSEDSIKKGQELEIFTQGEEIFDPETKESLGTLDTVKATIEVVTVYPKMCLCMDIEYERSPSLLTAVGMMQGQKVKVAKRLNVDSTQISGGLNNDDQKIHIGDLVRESLG
ncbi:hypothetical protein P9J83_15990 [Clostridium sporogenes]|uniref:Uncharacterized protein n=1 Tax=Clostridium sporogenes TaxID=1509 RepID=A0AAE4JUA5_CLOSG|nr:hypothetical protein [Clostridium sporogenes]MDS1004986.1 hypothetical protein [Clostridium sporogenes]